MKVLLKWEPSTDTGHLHFRWPKRTINGPEDRPVRTTWLHMGPSLLMSKNAQGLLGFIEFSGASKILAEEVVRQLREQDQYEPRFTHDRDSDAVDVWLNPSSVAPMTWLIQENLSMELGYDGLRRLSVIKVRKASSQLEPEILANARVA